MRRLRLSEEEASHAGGGDKQKEEELDRDSLRCHSEPTVTVSRMPGSETLPVETRGFNLSRAISEAPTNQRAYRTVQSDQHRMGRALRAESPQIP
eukprot:455839-Hanusia_phi.AAC.1